MYVTTVSLILSAVVFLTVNATPVLETQETLVRVQRQAQSNRNKSSQGQNSGTVSVGNSGDRFSVKVGPANGGNKGTILEGNFGKGDGYSLKVAPADGGVKIKGDVSKNFYESSNGRFQGAIFTQYEHTLGGNSHGKSDWTAGLRLRFNISL